MKLRTKNTVRRPLLSHKKYKRYARLAKKIRGNAEAYRQVAKDLRDRGKNVDARTWENWEKRANNAARDAVSMAKAASPVAYVARKKVKGALRRARSLRSKTV